MFRWLGTFIEDEFQLLVDFIEQQDGGRSQTDERLSHLEGKNTRNDRFIQLMEAIDARCKNGVAATWRDEPRKVDPNYVANAARRDGEPGMHVDAIKFVWRRLAYRCVDIPVYNYYKAKDLKFQLEDEINDVEMNRDKWDDWVGTVRGFIALAKENADIRVLTSLLRKNDAPVTR